MKNFGLRLQELRTKKGLTQEEIGKLLNISQSAVAYYESGKKQPPLEAIARLASFFNVSTDYLLGLTDDPTDPNAESIRKIDDALADDPELLEFWLETKKRPDLKLFLKQVKSASPKAIRQMMKIIKAIEDEEAAED